MENQPLSENMLKAFISLDWRDNGLLALFLSYHGHGHTIIYVPKELE